MREEDAGQVYLKLFAQNQERGGQHKCVLLYVRFCLMRTDEESY
jgi:hypothetical protein